MSKHVIHCKCDENCGNVLVIEGTSIRAEGGITAKGHSVVLRKADATRVAKILHNVFRGAK